MTKRPSGVTFGVNDELDRVARGLLSSTLTALISLEDASKEYTSRLQHRPPSSRVRPLSPSTRSTASDSNTTSRPSAEITGLKAPWFEVVLAVADRVARSVVALSRWRTNTSA